MRLSLPPPPPPSLVVVSEWKERKKVPTCSPLLPLECFPLPSSLRLLFFARDSIMSTASPPPSPLSVSFRFSARELCGPFADPI